MRLRLALLIAVLIPLPVLGQGLQILPVKLLDTSHEARDQSRDHASRLVLMADTLGQELAAGQVGPAEVSAACPRETQECLLGLLRQRGADKGLFVVVQKSSTLILQVFATLVDVQGERVIAHRELNFRGDNDEAWRRAGRFLARLVVAADAAPPAKGDP